ncbi:MAG: hypothetical protein KDD61_12000 [Bdellovibrionales bacterium]|nr:hypothetical protein [Bdellovibrionales bacterium]
MRLLSKRLFRTYLSTASAVAMAWTSASWASIPDDINVGKYKQIYMQSKSDSDQKRAVADGLSRDIDHVVSEIAGIEADIRRNENEIRYSENEISKLYTRISDSEQDNIQMEQQIDDNLVGIDRNRTRMIQLEREIQDISDEINRLEQRRRVVQENHDRQVREVQRTKDHHDRIEGQLSQLRREKAQTDKEVQDKLQSVQRITQRIDNLKKEKQTKIDAIPRLRQQIQNHRTQIQQLQNKVEQAKQDLPKLQNRLSRIDAQQKKIQQNIQEKRQEIQKLQRSQDPQKKQKIEALQKEIVALRGQAQTLSQQEKNVRNQLQAKRKEMQDGQKGIQQNQAEITNKQSQIQSHEKRIAEIDPQIQQLEQNRSTESAQVPQLRKRSQDLQAKIENIQPRYQQAKRELDKEQDKLTDIRQRLQLVRSNIQNKKEEQDRLDRHVAQLRYDNQQLNTENRRLEGAIEDNRTTIRLSRETIAHLQNQISQNEQRITDLNQELRRKEGEETQLRSDYAQADQVARQAEAVTEQHRQKYIAVQAQYDSEYKAAQNEGAQQGQPLGDAGGVAPGESAGRQAGTTEGESFGTEEGLLAGYLNGLQDGMTEGKTKGYQHGLHLPVNYDKGYKEGYEKGVQIAKEIAHRENYLPTRAEHKKKLLKEVLRNVVELDNKTARGSLSVSGNGLVALSGEFPSLQALGLASPSSGNMIPTTTSADSWDDLLALIDRVKAKMKAIPNHAVIDSGTGVVTFPIPVDRSQAQCHQRYVDFVNACLESFEEAYKDAFAASYKVAFRQEKIVAFDQARPLAYAKVETQRHAEGHQYAYAIAYATWDAIGADEAKNNGIKQGREDGRNNTIAKARQEATAKAVQDENQYFATNPVIRLKGVSFVNATTGKVAETKAGDEILLSADVSNFGMMASQVGQVKVKWEALTNNVIVDSTLHKLVGVPGKTKAHVKSIAYAKIDPMAVLSETVRLKVTMYQPDGEMESQIIEFKTKQHLNAVIDANVEAEVEQNSNQFVLVKISNKSKVDSPKDLEVKMTFPAGSGFDGRNDSGNFGRLKAGETKSQMFTYDVKRAKVGSTVPLTITVYFGGQVSAQKVYKVKVKAQGSSCQPWETDCF